MNETIFSNILLVFISVMTVMIYYKITHTESYSKCDDCAKTLIKNRDCDQLMYPYSDTCANASGLTDTDTINKIGEYLEKNSNWTKRCSGAPYNSPCLS